MDVIFFGQVVLTISIAFGTLNIIHRWATKKFDIGLLIFQILLFMCGSVYYFYL